MKVYIVTSGCYSDYSIEKVFLDKEKAEKYAKLYNGWGDVGRIEEYETSDDAEIEELTFVEVHYYENSPFDEDGVEFEVRKSNSLDDEISDLKRNYLFRCEGDRLEFEIQRPIYSSNYDEEFLRNKYTKVCHDLATQIKHLIKVEKWTKDMITTWFNTEADKIID